MSVDLCFLFFSFSFLKCVLPHPPSKAERTQLSFLVLLSTAINCKKHTGKWMSTSRNPTTKTKPSLLFNNKIVNGKGDPQRYLKRSGNWVMTWLFSSCPPKWFLSLSPPPGGHLFSTKHKQFVKDWLLLVLSFEHNKLQRSYTRKITTSHEPL